MTEHTNACAEGRESYASYVEIVGDVADAMDLYRDVLESTNYCKGEFMPLTREDGKVVVAMDDVDASP